MESADAGLGTPSFRDRVALCALRATGIPGTPRAVETVSRWFRGVSIPLPTFGVLARQSPRETNPVGVPEIHCYYWGAHGHFPFLNHCMRTCKGYSQSGGAKRSRTLAAAASPERESSRAGRGRSSGARARAIVSNPDTRKPARQSHSKNRAKFRTNSPAPFTGYVAHPMPPWRHYNINTLLQCPVSRAIHSGNNSGIVGECVCK